MIDDISNSKFIQFLLSLLVGLLIFQYRNYFGIGDKFNKLKVKWAKISRKKKYLVIFILVLSCVQIYHLVIYYNIYRNEKAAIRELRVIYAKQMNYMSSRQINEDKDDYAEFCLINELSGKWKERAGKYSRGIGRRYITDKSGKFPRSGYYFQMFLPHIDGPLTDDKPPPKSRDKATIDAQESQFLIYAWPIEYEWTGKRCFVMDLSGWIAYADNIKQNGKNSFFYSGDISPSFNAAIPLKNAAKVTSVYWGGTLPEKRENVGYYPHHTILLDGERGIDGQIWRYLRE